jgi:hypothetical protein
MATKRYCQLVVASAVAALALIALFNVLVDPFGAYPAIHLKTFDPFRGSVFTRLARAEMARSGKWEMVILGTSRPKGGMPAGHPAFASNHVCNLSLDAAHMNEIETIFHYTRVRNPLRRVLLCLDMTISRPPGPLVAEFLESRFNPKLSMFEYHCKNVIGAAATDESFKFLVRRMARRFSTRGSARWFSSPLVGARHGATRGVRANVAITGLQLRHRPANTRRNECAATRARDVPRRRTSN